MVAAASLGALLVVVGGGFERASAQDEAGQPAQLHAGSCDELGEVAFSLSGVGAAVDVAGTAVAESELVGPESALAVATSRTTIEAAVSDLVNEAHAIAIYASAEATAEPIACGDVGGLQTMQMAGMLMPGDELVVGLAERNDSGFSGIALLRAEGGSEATITIYLAEGLSGEGATPATPTSR
jgi:hypothetical protein